MPTLVADALTFDFLLLFLTFLSLSSRLSCHINFLFIEILCRCVFFVAVAADDADDDAAAA